MFEAFRRLTRSHETPDRYRMSLQIGKSVHMIGFDDSRLSEAADKWEWMPRTRSIAFALPEGVDRLMWGAAAFKFGELFPDASWPPFLVLDLDPPAGEFAQKCAVVIRLLDEQKEEVFTSHIKLATPRVLIVPLSSEVRGLITHIRLDGAGELPPLKLTLSVPNRRAVEQFRSKKSRAGGRPESKLTGLSALVEHSGDRRFSWDGALRETLASDNSRYRIGVLDRSIAERTEGFVALRVDQGVMAHSYVHCAGYVFDDSATDGLFGWRGVMTPHNNLANAALARHLADARRNGLPTTLMFDDATLCKPFFEDFREGFDECMPARDSATLFDAEMVES